MREFSWQCFANTGDVNAYLLYKAAINDTEVASDDDESEGEIVLMDVRGDTCFTE